MLPFTGYCDICDKEISHPKSWPRHLKSKKHIKKLNEKQIRTIVDVENTKKITLNTDLEKNNNKFNCKYCNKLFNRKDNRFRHENKYCKKIKDSSKDNQDKTQVIQQQTINTTNNTTTNNTNNTINQHIHINIYGKEDYSKILTERKWEQLCDMAKKPQALQLITDMYGSTPNTSIQYPNMSQPYALVKIAENNWNKQYLPPLIEDILDKLPFTVGCMFFKYFNDTKHEYVDEYDWLNDVKQGEKIVKDIKNMVKDKATRKELECHLKATLYNNTSIINDIKNNINNNI